MNDIAYRADLDHPAGVHHSNTVGALGDHAHVVGDQHHRCAAISSQLFKQSDDLRLDRYIERGGRLIGDDQLRVSGQCQGDHHALTHAAGELMRVSDRCVRAPPECRLIRAVRWHAGVASLVLPPRCVWMVSISWLPIDTSGLRAVSGSWNIAPILRPRIAPHGVFTQVVDALARQGNLATGDAPGRLEQTNDGSAGQGFAGTRLTHHAQHLAFGDRERHIIDRR